jgi:hypothetical protein
MERHTYLRTHDLSSEHVVLDLGQVAADLHGEPSRDASREGVTLVKQGGLSLVPTEWRQWTTRPSF